VRQLPDSVRLERLKCDGIGVLRRQSGAQDLVVGPGLHLARVDRAVQRWVEGEPVPRIEVAQTIGDQRAVPAVRVARVVHAGHVLCQPTSRLVLWRVWITRAEMLPIHHIHITDRSNNEDDEQRPPSPLTQPGRDARHRQLEWPAAPPVEHGQHRIQSQTAQCQQSERAEDKHARGIAELVKQLAARVDARPRHSPHIDPCQREEHQRTDKHERPERAPRAQPPAHRPRQGQQQEEGPDAGVGVEFLRRLRGRSIGPPGIARKVVAQNLTEGMRPGKLRVYLLGQRRPELDQRQELNGRESERQNRNEGQGAQAGEVQG